jgi:hypothetical protein
VRNRDIQNIWSEEEKSSSRAEEGTSGEPINQPSSRNQRSRVQGRQQRHRRAHAATQPQAARGGVMKTSSERAFLPIAQIVRVPVGVPDRRGMLAAQSKPSTVNKVPANVESTRPRPTVPYGRCLHGCVAIRALHGAAGRAAQWREARAHHRERRRVCLHTTLKRTL